MTDKTKIFLIYAFVAVFGILLISGFVFIRKASLAKQRIYQKAVDVGKEEVTDFLTLDEDLVATNQAGEVVRLSDLKDKVWLMAQFFAECPMCAQRNADHLLKFYEKYRSNPDFMVICVSVDPETDDVKRLSEIAASLNVESKNWWFLTGDRQTLHDYMEKEMRFIGIRERSDPLEIETKGRYSHDMGIAVFGKGLVMRAKRDLYFAREQGGHGLYETYEKTILNAIERSLNDE